MALRGPRSFELARSPSGSHSSRQLERLRPTELGGDPFLAPRMLAGWRRSRTWLQRGHRHDGHPPTPPQEPAMESKAKLLGHPIHPMLIVFPLALLPVAVLADALYLATGTADFARFAFWSISIGLVGGLLAAL